MSSATKRKSAATARANASAKRRATTPGTAAPGVSSALVGTRATASSGTAHAPLSPRHQGKLTRRSPLLGTPLKVAVVVGVAIAVLAWIYVNSQRSGAGTSGSGQYVYAVGQPGPGQAAPTFTLASTKGGSFDLAAYHGKTVLLYFQEGLTCQPCWDQLKDLSGQTSQLKALGIDQVVSITTDPVDALAQKVTDEGIPFPVLSDPNLTVSRTYHANQYGMMGDSRDGHSFIVVGPDGLIRWRADFGGAPNYTMYVPIATLFADLQKGMHVTTP